MKKIVASVGLFAVGASGVQAASVAALTADAAKPWSISATFRGFYDDNVNTAPNKSDRVEAFGYEISPAFSLNWKLEQTTLSLGYVYSFHYYDHTPPGNAEKYDQTHSFTALLNHAFSERYVLNVQDSFVIGQEPDFLRANDTFSTYQRVPGDNIRNHGQIKLNAQLSRVFGVELGYENSFFHYDDKGGNFLAPSRAGLLDRIEQYFHVDGRWQVQRETIGVVGYQYGMADYNGNEVIGHELIGFALPLLTPIYHNFNSDVRNNRSHYGYVGVEHVFRPDLTGTVHIGARYTDFYNSAHDESNIGPYATASLEYTYAPESTLELGVTHDRNATDLFQATSGKFTTDQESTAVFGSINHRIMPRLYGSILGQFQNSTLNGGPLNNVDEKYYLVGLNVEYRFNSHLSAHVGYNYDKLNSEANRSFDRNRAYIGVTATY